jgi:hypothetical protein
MSWDTYLGKFEVVHAASHDHALAQAAPAPTTIAVPGLLVQPIT